MLILDSIRLASGALAPELCGAPARERMGRADVNASWMAIVRAAVPAAYCIDEAYGGPVW